MILGSLVFPRRDSQTAPPPPLVSLRSNRRAGDMPPKGPRSTLISMLCTEEDPSLRSTDVESRRLPAELPGFYYDPEKNRYFPIRGPIPGAAARRGTPAPPPAVDTTGCSRKRARRPELLNAREMYGGGVMFSNKAARSTFKQQCHYAQASQPMVIARATYSLLSCALLYCNTLFFSSSCGLAGLEVPSHHLCG
jgi:hypothetical protein